MTFPVKLLFDLDGTISDPLEGIARSVNFALEALGLPGREAQELARFVGPPLDETFRFAAGTDDKEEIARFVAKFRERYGEVGYSENELYPGVAQALESLAARGVPMGVCTSKRGDFAEKILDMFGLRDLFGVVSGGDLGVRKGEQIAALLHEGKVDRRTIMVGDRAVDLVAAHSNGLPSAGVLWGYGDRAELESERPSAILETPAQLARLAA